MKNIIKRWLGIDILRRNSECDARSLILLENRVAELESETRMFEGDQAREDGVKEIVLHLCRFLGVRPGREFYQEPVGDPEMMTKRRFWLEKGKKNTKITER